MNDITETGPLGLRGIRNPAIASANAALRDAEDVVNLNSNINKVNEYRKSHYKRVDASLENAKSGITDDGLIRSRGKGVEYYDIESPESDYGSSKYDDGLIHGGITANEIQDKRANSQSGLEQLGASWIRGLGLTGTTFLNDTLGAVYGAVAGIIDGKFSSYIDNDFTRTMDSFNDYLKESLPIYESVEQQNRPWYENLGTSAFYGNLIEQQGYMAGAVGAGMLTGGAVRATKLPVLITKLANSAKVGRASTSLISSTIVAMGEGALEARQAKDEYMNIQIQKSKEDYNEELEYINSKYNDSYIDTNLYSSRLKIANDYHAQQLKNLKGASIDVKSALIAAENDRHYRVIDGIKNSASGRNLRIEKKQELDDKYERRLTEAKELSDRVGNMTMAHNLPLLVASEMLQFGKLFNKGWVGAKLAKNIEFRAGKYVSTMTSGKGITKAVMTPMSEAVEEMSQSIITQGSIGYYDAELNSYYRAKNDPNNEDKLNQYLSSFYNATISSLQSDEAQEGAFSGFISSAIGVPTFGRHNNADAFIGKGKSVGISAGIGGYYSEYKKRQIMEEDAATKLNNVVNSPRYKVYKDQIVSNAFYEDQVDESLDTDNKFTYETAKHNQLFSDIDAFSNAGKLGDFVAMTKEATATDDKNLEDIVKNTTTKTEDGKFIGPYVSDTGVPMYDTPEGKKQMIKELTDNRDMMLSKVDKYIQAKDEIDTVTNGKLTSNQLEELSWIKSNIDNWEEETSKLSGKFKGTLNKLLTSLNQQLDVAEFERDNRLSNTESEVDDSAINDEFNSNNSALIKYKKNIEFLLSKNPNNTIETLLSNSEFAKSMPLLLADSYSKGELSDIEVYNTVHDMKYSVKLNNSIRQFSTKLQEYLTTPEKITEVHKKIDEENSKKKLDTKKEFIKKELSNSSSQQEFRESLEEAEADYARKFNAMKDLAQENNPFAIEELQIKSYQAVINGELDKIPNPEIKEAALKLYSDIVKHSSLISDIQDTNHRLLNDLEYFDDGERTLDESKVLHKAAVEYIIGAQNKANNDKSRGTLVSNPTINAGVADASSPALEQGGNTGSPTSPGSLSHSTNIVNNPESESSPVLINNNAKPLSTEDIIKLNKQVTVYTQDRGDLDRDINTVYDYIISSISEFILSEKYDKDNPKLVPLGDDPRYYIAYKYMNDKGAFEYVNSGKLKKNTKVYFGVDPLFDDGNSVLMYVKDNNGSYQLIGALHKNVQKQDQFLGEKYIVDKVLEEYRQSGEQSQFISPSITSKVSTIIAGDLEYNNSVDTHLSNVLDEVDKGIVVFGIVKNGVINTNDALQPKDMKVPNNLAGQEGRLYMFIQGQDGKWIPSAVRVSHFNKSETDLHNKDSEFSNSSIGKNLRALIESLDITNNDTAVNNVNNFIKQLSDILYLGDVVIKSFSKTDLLTGNTVQSLLIKKIGSAPIILNPESKSFHEDLINALYTINTVFQIDVNRINIGSENSHYINSNILKTNLKSTNVRGAWFKAYSVDNGGKQIENNAKEQVNTRLKALSSNTTADIPVQSSVNNPNDSIDTADTYTIDTVNRVIYNSKGEAYTTLTPEMELLIDLEAVNELHGTNKDGVNLKGSIALLNRVDKDGSPIAVDRINKKYATQEQIKELFPEELERKRQEMINESSKKGDKIAKNNIKGTIDELDSTKSKKRRRPGSYRLNDSKDNTRYTKTSLEAELNWLNKVLPHLSKNNMVAIHNGLPNAATHNVEVWGEFVDGMVKLSKTGATGTVYHEAFHVVFQTLLLSAEKELILNEASKYFNIPRSEQGDLQLEEKLAEGFREYVISKQNPFNGDGTLFEKIKQFFKSLRVKVMNWNNINPIINNYYKFINNGKYSTKGIEVKYLRNKSNEVNNLESTNKIVSFANVNPILQSRLESKGWTEKDFNRLSQREKIKAIECINY